MECRQVVAFGPGGGRLISTSGGRETVKLWDVGTWQELPTLSGAGSYLWQTLISCHPLAIGSWQHNLARIVKPPCLLQLRAKCETSFRGGFASAPLVTGT